MSNLTVNGHSVITYMSPENTEKYLNDVRTTQNSTIDVWAGKTTDQHLVLRRHYQSIDKEDVGGFYDRILDNKAILELNAGKTFRYRVPITTQTGLETTHDTSGGKSGKVGAGGDTFTIGLNQEFKEGEQFTVDLESGPQLMVVGQAYNDGLGFIHEVVIADASVDAYPTEYLKAGVSYKEGSHNTGEFGTVFAGIRFPSKQGYAECTFSLGSITGVEHKVTDDADSRNLNAFESESASGLLAHAEDWVRDNDLEEFIARFATKAINGERQVDYNSANIGSVVEELVRHTLDQKLANRIVFQKAAIVQTGNGEVRMNDGIISTLKRAERIFYGRTVMMSDLIKVSDALYRDNTRRSWKDRDITINAATQAYTKLLELLNGFAGQVVEDMSKFIGADSVVKGLVSGPIDAMEIHSPQFDVFNVPQVGRVRVIEDRSLEVTTGRSRQNRGYNTTGRDSSSFRAIATRTDGTAPRMVEIPNDVNFGPGARDNASMYIVKTAGQPLTVSGTIRGRMPNRRNGEFSGIEAAYKERSTEYWAYGSVDVFLPVPEEFVILESKR